MKKSIVNIGLCAALALTATSCKKGWLEGVNDNPNEVTAVVPSLLLPSIEAHLAYGIGGDLSRLTSTVTQQTTGAARQFATYQIYDITETETDNLWKFNLYGGPLNDLYDLMKDCSAKGYNHYLGVGKILMAYGLMVTTDAFGDIPYSEAFLGGDNLQPAFDSQEEIYGTIQTLLADGKALFAEDGGDLTPSDDDLMYGGDLDLWTRFANVLSAKAYLHLGKVSPANYTNALTALGTEGVDCFGSNAEDAIYHFGVGETEAGPWFQFNDQRGDISFDGYLSDTMIGMADPRYDLFIDSANGFMMGSFYGNPDAPFDYATYVEQKFIEAEAAFQTGDLARAASAHNAGVQASLDRLGVSDATFTTNYGSETAGTISLAKIMLQKYVAMYTNVEAFTDWRRTGFPALVAVPGNVTNDVIPRRMPMAQSERLFNPNAPAPQTITTPVWWDQ